MTTFIASACAKALRGISSRFGAKPRAANENRNTTMATKNRRAFTLIELLVAIAMIMVLAGLAVLFVRFDDQARAGRGAQQLQGWLNIAKSRALRDQGPRGLRLVR